MASTSTGSDIKTLPKLAPTSVVFRRMSSAEEEEQQFKTRAAVNEYISKMFGDGPTESEKTFLDALNKNGKFSLRLITTYIYMLWTMAAILLGYNIINEESFVVRCEIPALERCLNFSDVLDVSLLNKTPSIDNFVSKQYCRYDDRDYFQLVATYSCHYQSMLRVIKLEKHIPNTKLCDNYVIFRRNVSKLRNNKVSNYISLREYFNLFCRDDVWSRVYTFTKLYGSALSTLLLAPTGDMFGRKRMFKIESLVYLLGCFMLFLPCKWCIAIGFFLYGFSTCTFFNLYVLCLELCSDVMVLWLGLLTIPLTLVLDVLGFIFHHNIKTWIYMHLATTVMLFALPFGLWYLTESARWLMFTGNPAAAWHVLKKNESTAISNDSNTLELSSVKGPSLINILRFFKKPIFRERISICILLYFLTSISFYVQEEEISKYVEVETGEFYLISFGIKIIIAVSAYFSAIKCGRRTTSFVFYCMLTVFDALTFMDNEYFDDNETLALLLYFRESLKIGVIFILFFYTIEIFPTPFRLTALNICAATTIIGITIQQHFYYICHSESNVVKYMPSFIASTTSALMITFLPNTANKGLPDTPRDALRFKITT